MEPSALATLRREVKRQEARKLARLRDHYHLARELGFSASEAKLLQGRSETYIRDLAKELPEGV